ncbi:hypothetical protein COCOBI_05-6870 [Coccomyxa sp. Obi]|nr:hypothetical protein COCOBI_05-6870 [Coccomyxa sp. Obi]
MWRTAEAYACMCGIGKFSVESRQINTCQRSRSKPPYRQPTDDILEEPKSGFLPVQSRQMVEGLQRAPQKQSPALLIGQSVCGWQ